jgi:hypothetical protein
MRRDKYRGVEAKLHPFITSALDGVEKQASALPPKETDLRTDWIGGQVETRTGLHVVKRTPVL